MSKTCRCEKEQKCIARNDSFVAAAVPLMRWMAENCHPHTQALVDCTSAELLEGLCRHLTYEFIEKDTKSQCNNIKQCESNYTELLGRWIHDHKSGCKCNLCEDSRRLLEREK